MPKSNGLWVGAFMMKRIGQYIIAMTGLLVLAGCGDEKKHKQVEAATSWLQSFYAEHPVQNGWNVQSISANENRVSINVSIPVKRHVEILKSRTRMQQAAIIKQMVCPPFETEIWTMITDKVEIWVGLNDEEELVASATCPHGG